MVVEFIVDCLWIVNMFMAFTTAYVSDVELRTDLKEIAMRYLLDGFVIDFLSTFSTLATFYIWP